MHVRVAPGSDAKEIGMLNEGGSRTRAPVGAVEERPMRVCRNVAALAAVAVFSVVVAAQQIYWGDEVPGGWHGEWPAEVQTVAERSGFTRTVSSTQLLEFISALK